MSPTHRNSMFVSLEFSHSLNSFGTFSLCLLWWITCNNYINGEGLITHPCFDPHFENTFSRFITVYSQTICIYPVLFINWTSSSLSLLSFHLHLYNWFLFFLLPPIYPSLFIYIMDSCRIKQAIFRTCHSRIVLVHRLHFKAMVCYHWMEHCL